MKIRIVINSMNVSQDNKILNTKIFKIALTDIKEK